MKVLKLMSKCTFKGFICGIVLTAILSTTVFSASVVKNITAVFDQMKIYVNGADKTPPEDTAPFIFNGKTYVPLRYVSEALGKKVSWDGNKKAIYINDTDDKREDTYFYSEPYSKADTNIEVNSQLKTIYCNWYSTYNDKTQSDKYLFKRSITYNLNGLAKNVYGKLTFSPDTEEPMEGKIKIYSDVGGILYESPYIRKSSNPIEFNFNATGILQIKVEFELLCQTVWKNGKLNIENFRYSKE